MPSNDYFYYSETERIKLTKEQEREIKNLYKEAYEEIKSRFKRLTQFTTESAFIKRTQLKSIGREIEKVLNNVDNKTEFMINENVNKMVGVVLENNQMFLQNHGYKDYINNTAIKNDVVNRIVSGKLYENKFNLNSSIWGDNKAKINEINKIISKGIIENKSIFEISKSLERYVNPNARKNIEWVKQNPGSRRKVDYNAQRLARTMVSHAYQESIVAATINNPFIVGYKWITSGLDSVCELCIDRETQNDFGLGAGVFPKDQLPLDHPNGMCTFEMVTNMTDDEINRAITEWYLGVGDSELNNALDKFSKSLK